MADHFIEPLTQICVGCGKSARDQFEKPSPCPAVTREFSNRHDGYTVQALITADERLVILQGGIPRLVLAQDAMFSLRDAIDEGVNELRESGHSLVMPK